jgi:hypothetical protein
MTVEKATANNNEVLAVISTGATSKGGFGSKGRLRWEAIRYAGEFFNPLKSATAVKVLRRLFSLGRQEVGVVASDG